MHWNSGCSNNKQTLCLTTRPRTSTRIWFLFGERVFCVTAQLFVTINASISLIYKKALRESIEDSDRQDLHLCDTDWMCSTGCTLLVCSKYLLLKYAKCVLACLKLYDQYNTAVLNLDQQLPSATYGITLMTTEREI